jgi:[NiFe] hydrogenase assembly HybE family chaperone
MDEARLADCARLAAALEEHFQAVYLRSMRDVPICNDALDVAATEFRLLGFWAFGIVVTPWFMNLFAAPLPGQAPAAQGIDMPAAKRIGLPAGEVEFKPAELDGFPGLLSCSLFSPMDSFADHQSALDTAQAALDLLFTPPAAAPGKTS